MAKKIDDMTHDERVEYLSTATRVTVGTVGQIGTDENGKNIIKNYYVAKIRGRVVGNNEKWKFDTKEEAREHGWEILDRWRKEWREKQEAQDE
jgi:hypothetical protein